MTLNPIGRKLPVAGAAGDEGLALGRRVRVHVRGPPLLAVLSLQVLGLAAARAHVPASLVNED